MAGDSSAQDRILDAFEEAIVSYGVPGSSFARIAERGGFHRTLIQHHFGTRARLVEASLDRLCDYYERRLGERIGAAAHHDTLGELMDWLLSPFGDEGPPRVALAVDAFVAAAGTDAAIRRRLAALYQRFADALADSMSPHAPDTARSQLEAAAFSITCLSFGRAGLDTLGLEMAGTLTARRACDTILRGVDIGPP